jgi:hypothetical protein
MRHNTAVQSSNFSRLQSEFRSSCWSPGVLEFGELRTLLSEDSDTVTVTITVAIHLQARVCLKILTFVIPENFLHPYHIKQALPPLSPGRPPGQVPLATPAAER